MSVLRAFWVGGGVCGLQGTLTNETRCLCCETVTARDESFLDLSLDIEQNSSVTACLRNFSSTETLSGNDKFFCDKCCRYARSHVCCAPSILYLLSRLSASNGGVQEFHTECRRLGEDSCSRLCPSPCTWTLQSRKQGMHSRRKQSLLRSCV